uniref:hypothetical protein n=1 Tax=Streptomyces capuensis TaxID=1464056 RepID=UPI00131D8DD1
MEAALHLAQVHQVPPGPKRKRKGGGGGGRQFYEYATQIYNDSRADGPARELLLAVAYAITTVPPIEGNGKAQWALVKKALGPTWGYRSRIEELVSRDVPQYVPPDRQVGGYSERTRRCRAPRLRPYRERTVPGHEYTSAQRIAQAKREEEDFRNVENICGDLGHDRVVEKLPDTGWHKYHYFCPRHRDHLAR